MKRIAAAERHQNVATAEGRGKDLSWKTYFAGAVALAFAAAHFFDGCALSRLHSQPLIARQGRKTVALEKSFAPAGASFCPNGNHGLQPWLYSGRRSAAPFVSTRIPRDQEF
ncbi:MAG: hypothetical protein DMG13_08420 [Acidobacteria bacterium]|nr:MAG: hypothetical protein DMG13_08420 [Acidobacteriota bacterium]